MAEYSKQLAAGFITHFYGAIDKRLEEKTKAELLAYDVREGYDGLFVICKDDKLLYAFDKTMTPSAETGNFYELTGRNFIITDDVFNYDATKRNNYTIYLQPDINATTSYPAGLYRFDSVESRYKLLEGYEIREEDKIKLFNNIYSTNNVLDPAFDATTLISDIKTGADKGFYDRKYVAVENKHAVECSFVAATTDPAVAEHLEFIYNDKYYKRFATDLYGYTISNDYEIIDKMYDKSSTPWTIIPGVKEKLYYLTTADRSSTTSDLKYPGLYGWNGTEYFKVTGNYDEKSILSSNTLGSESKIHTVIGGYIKNKKMVAGGTFSSSSITTDANGELTDVNITLSKPLINAFLDAGLFSPSIEVMFSFANSSKNVVVDNLRCIVYPTEKESIENSSFELSGDYSNVKVVYNTSGNYVATLNMTKENGFEANTTYTKIDIYIPYNPEYSYVNNKYLDLDETTITYKNPLDKTAGPLHAKSAIEIATFPTTGILPETIYRLTTEETISGKTYLPGEYVYDAATGWIHLNCYEIIDKMYDTSGTTPVLIPGVKEKMYYLTTFQRVVISGIRYTRTPGLYGWNGTDYFKVNDVFDEKTILTVPGFGNKAMPARTVIGGYRDILGTGGVEFDQTFTTDADGAIINQTVTPEKVRMNIIVDVMERNKPVIFSLINSTAGSVFLEGELSIYPTASASAANSTFEVKGDDFYFKVVYTEAGEGAYSMTLNVTKEAGLIANTTYTFSISCTTVDYHYVNNRFIEMDNTTITDVNPLDKTIGPLHAKSAVEVATFPTTGILPETIYRLTTEITISGKKYAPGLYVYDTTGTDPVWLAVGGSEVDEKTILSTDDDGELVPLHTEVGGYKTTEGDVFRITTTNIGWYGSSGAGGGECNFVTASNKYNPKLNDRFIIEMFIKETGKHIVSIFKVDSVRSVEERVFDLRATSDDEFFNTNTYFTVQCIAGKMSGPVDVKEKMVPTDSHVYDMIMRPYEETSYIKSKYIKTDDSSIIKDGNTITSAIGGSKNYEVKKTFLEDYVAGGISDTNKTFQFRSTNSTADKLLYNYDFKDNNTIVEFTCAVSGECFSIHTIDYVYDDAYTKTKADGSKYFRGVYPLKKTSYIKLTDYFTSHGYEEWIVDTNPSYFEDDYEIKSYQSGGIMVQGKTLTIKEYTAIPVSSEFIDVDEKTILSTDEDGNVSPLHTAVSGWIEKVSAAPEADKTQTLTSDASVETSYFNDESSVHGIKVYVLSHWNGATTINYNLYSLSDLSSGSNFTLKIKTTDGNIVSIGTYYYDRKSVSDEEYIFKRELTGFSFEIEMKLKVIDENNFIIEDMGYVCLADAPLTVDKYNFRDLVFVFNDDVKNDVIHPIKSEFLNIDNTTLVNDESLVGAETGLLHAKSAIATDKLSTITTPLDETIYRLTADETIGTTLYKAGLYVYDSTLATPSWIFAGGSTTVDGITIRDKDDTGAAINLKTTVGGGYSGTKEQYYTFNRAMPTDYSDDYYYDYSSLPISSLSGKTIKITYGYMNLPTGGGGWYRCYLKSQTLNKISDTQFELVGRFQEGTHTVWVSWLFDTTNLAKTKMKCTTALFEDNSRSTIAVYDNFQFINNTFINIDDTTIVTDSSTGKLKVPISSDGGLQTTTAGISVKLSALGGLSCSSSGIAIWPRENGGLTTSSEGASVLLKSNGGLSCTADGLHLTIPYSSGISLPTTGIEGEIFFLYSV